MIPAPQFERIKQYFSRHKPSIQEIVREQTSGGIVFRRNSATNEIEILLMQDSKDRWTIPKGHVEEGETGQQTAEREVREEVGLQDMETLCWLGKIHFRYRRPQTQDRRPQSAEKAQNANPNHHALVLMTMQIYLIKAQGNTNNLKKEKWINEVGWFPIQKALDMIQYEDIGKLMLLAMKKIRSAR